MTTTKAPGTTTMMNQVKLHLDVTTECASHQVIDVTDGLIVMTGKMNQHVENKARKSRWRKSRWRRNK